jgi:epoxyqueuosine reductase
MNFEHDNLSGGQENLTRLAADIKSWGRALGFDEVGITDTGLSAAEAGLAAWLEAGCHGQMDYMYKHGLKRSRPEALVPGTRRVISARMSYLPDAEDALAVLDDPARAYVSRYALGRDYHKVLRARLQRLPTGSPPCPMRPGFSSIRRRSWRSPSPRRRAGLAGQAHPAAVPAGGVVLLSGRDLHRPAAAGRCGYRRPLRKLQRLHLGLPDRGDRCTLPGRRPSLHLVSDHRVEGGDPGGVPADDRQPDIRLRRLPAGMSMEPIRPQGCRTRFRPRHGLDGARLAELFCWSETDFNERMAGSPIYRIGHERWLRNLAIALGNAPSAEDVLAALEKRREDASLMVREHVAWALRQHDGPHVQGAV